MTNVLIIIGALSIIAYLGATIRIYSYLKEKYEKMESFIFINFFIFRYVSKYREKTKSETGKVGYLFHVWLISINLALACFIIVILNKYLF